MTRQEFINQMALMDDAEFDNLVQMFSNSTNVQITEETPTQNEVEFKENGGVIQENLESQLQSMLSEEDYLKLTTNFSKL